MISFSPPDITEAEINEVVDALRSGWITTGPRTKKFESNLATYIGNSKVCCLNSATSALELALRILGVGPGDEVITSAYTYTASCSVICHVGATPVLADVSPESYLIDLSEIEKLITEKTKAIIPVDIAGIMCDYDRLFNIVDSKKHLFQASSLLQSKLGRIAIIADGAHALGSIYKGKMCGSVADFTSFSFHAVKNLTTAEGGALTWKNNENIDSEEIYKELQLLSLHGQNKDALAKTQLGAWEYDIVSPSYKCNMTDIMSAIGLIQLERYPSLLKRRAQLVELYKEGLKNLPIGIVNHQTKFCESSRHLMLTRINGYSEEKRNQFIIKMAEKGISTNVHYKPLPLHTAYRKLGFKIKDFPNSYNQYQNEVTLPLHTLLSDEDVKYITHTYKSCLGY